MNPARHFRDKIAMQYIAYVLTTCGGPCS